MINKSSEPWACILLIFNMWQLSIIYGSIAAENHKV